MTCRTHLYRTHGKLLLPPLVDFSCVACIRSSWAIFSFFICIFFSMLEGEGSPCERRAPVLLDLRTAFFCLAAVLHGGGISCTSGKLINIDPCLLGNARPLAVALAEVCRIGVGGSTTTLQYKPVIFCAKNAPMSRLFGVTPHVEWHSGFVCRKRHGECLHESCERVKVND